MRGPRPGMRVPVCRFISLGHCWRDDRRGVAAVEFGFIAPIVLLIFMAVFEFGRAYALHRRFNNVGEMIGNLLAREDTSSVKGVTPEILQGIYDLVPPIMGGAAEAATLTVQVIPLHAQSNVVRVYARPAGRSAVAPTCSAYAVKPQVQEVLKANSQGLVLVKATYSYAPLFFSSVMGAMTWEYETLFTPRRACIGFTSGTTVYTCSNPCS